MKIGQISDIHWRSLTRHEEYVFVFQRLMEQMRKERVDAVVCTGDIYHTKTQNISPEFIEKLAWMITTISDEIPLYMILGNHDGNLNNADRQDAISPINKLLNRNNVHLLKASCSYPMKEDPRFVLGAFSPFDKEGWDTVKPWQGCVNIALFHGSVHGCVMDNGYQLPETEAKTSLFNGWDFALLGDIHKQQFLGAREDYDGIEKPWIGYPGSLIQQSHGEGLEKGWLLWDIRSNEDWDVEFKQIENPWKFMDVEWQGNVSDTLGKLSNQIGSSNLKELRLRAVINEGEVPRVVRDLFVKSAKTLYPISGVSFKKTKSKNQQATTVEAEAPSNLRTDPKAFTTLLEQYFKKVGVTLDPTQVEAINKLGSSYLKAAIESEPPTGRGTEWTVTKLEFDNLYTYGKQNSINLEHKSGIIGIDGPNQVGKSSILGALMFALYGTSDRGPIKTSYIINNNSKAGSAKVEIMIANGIRYLFERTATKASKKGQVDEEKATSTLAITKLFPSGVTEEIKVTEDSIIDSEKVIREIIGQPQDLLLTSFATQGNLGQLIALGPTDRKTFLNKALDFDLIEKVNKLVAADAALLAAKTKGISAEDIQVVISQTKNKIALCEKVIEQINNEIAINDLALLEEKVWYEGHKAKLTQLRSEEQRRNGLEQEVRKLRQQLLTAKASLQRIAFELEEKYSELEQAELEVAAFTNLSNLTKELAEVSRKETALKVSSAEVSRDVTESRKGLKVLNEVPCGTDLQSVCKFVSGAKKNAERLPELEARSVELSDKLAEINTSLTKLTQTINQGNALLKKRDALQKQVSDLENSHSRLEESVGANTKTLQITEESLNGLCVVDTKELLEAQKREVILRELQEHQKTLSTDLLKEVSQKAANQTKLSSLTKELEEVVNTKEQMKLFELLQSAVSKNGIPAMVLETQLPLVNDHINNVLSGVADFKVYLKTTVGSNSLDIILKDGDTERVIEVCCGMEQTIAAIAIRVALLGITTLPKPDFFILDEPFGPLDSGNLAICANLLSSLKDRFKMILMVTHLQPMKEIMDDVMEVTSTKNVSLVKYN